MRIGCSYTRSLPATRQRSFRWPTRRSAVNLGPRRLGEQCTRIWQAVFTKALTNGANRRQSGL